MVVPVPEPQLASFMLEVCVLLLFAGVLGEFTRRTLGVAMIGNVFAGVLLGPSCLGRLAPQFAGSLFSSESGEYVSLMTSFALTLFMFVSGYEIGLASVVRYFRLAKWIAFACLVTPIVIIFPTSFMCAAVINPGVAPVVTASFMATVLSITAVPIVIRVLSDVGLARHEIAIPVKTAAVINDLIGCLLVTLVISFTDTTHGAGSVSTLDTMLGALVLISVGGVGPWIATKILKSMHHQNCTDVSRIILQVCAAFGGFYLAELVHMHGAFGALMAGIAMGDVDELYLKRELREASETMIGSIAAPFFLATIGLRVDFLSSFDSVVVGTVFVLAIGSKVLGGLWGGRLAGYDLSTSAAIGATMGSNGAIVIVMAMLAESKGIISTQLMAAIVIAALASGMVAALVLRLVFGSASSSNTKEVSRTA